MSTADDPFEQALQSNHFEDAAHLAAELSEPERQSRLERLEERRRAAEEVAAQLASSISALARQHEYHALLDIDEDPATEQTLQLLPASTQERARIHLRGARHWAQRQAESNRRRLDEARAALDQLDLGLARSIMNRIDDRFLGEADRDLRDQTLLDLSARGMEAEELSAAAAQVLREEQPVRRRWWQRRGDR